MRHRRLIAVAAIAVFPWGGVSTAGAATLTVDDDHVECPTAEYTSVQTAVDAAALQNAGTPAGEADTVVICPGSYVEGSGDPGTNALTIDKPLTLKGAGADLVSISPRARAPSGSIAGPTPDIRSGVGNIVSVVGSPSAPIDVAISGITVDGEDPQGGPVASAAGVVYLDATGSISRSRVTNVVTSEDAEAYPLYGGWRSSIPGYGIVQTSATPVEILGERRLTISSTRVDRYNRAGILIDGSIDDVAPLTPSGVTNKGIVQGSQIVGRVECESFEADGDCSDVGLLGTGPLFGQDGIRVTSNSRLEVSDSLISQNLVNGTGAPVRGASTDNANLTLAAGIRLLGASLTAYSEEDGQTIHSFASRSNIVDNAYGVLNLGTDGTTTATGTPASTDALGDVFRAEDNWWGLGYSSVANAGPAVAPTTNPPIPENPVGGTLTPDGGAQTSDSVDFYPFRSGSQGDGFNGQYAIVDAPMPVDDAAPDDVSLEASSLSEEPGRAVTLSATGSDDFGVRRVTFYDGSAAVGTATTPPYSASAVVAADAACDGTRSYSALVEDSSGQTTASEPVALTVTCPFVPPPDRDRDPDPPDRGEDPEPPARGDDPAPPGRGADTQPPPAAPGVTFANVRRTLGRATRIAFRPLTPAGFVSAVVLLGDRTVCTVRAAPFHCTVRPTGADVGRQVLRVVVTDARRSTAQASMNVVVPKFAARMRTRMTTRRAHGGRVERTFAVTVVRQSAVTARQGCRGGHVTLVVKRGRRTVVNQQVRLTGSCTVKRSVTATRRGGAFRVSAKFGGNAVMRAASSSRRFS